MAVGFDALTRVPAKRDAPLARRGDARAHALTQQISFELHQCGHQGRNQLAIRAGHLKNGRRSVAKCRSVSKCTSTGTGMPRRELLTEPQRLAFTVHATEANDYSHCKPLITMMATSS